MYCEDIDCEDIDCLVHILPTPQLFHIDSGFHAVSEVVYLRAIVSCRQFMLVAQHD